MVEGNEEGKNRCSERFYMDSVARETILLAAEITHACQTGKSKQSKAKKTYMHIKEIHFLSYTTTFKIGKGQKKP